MQHYRCFRVWAISTNAERIADTIVWYPNNCTMPHATSLDTAAFAAYDLTQALLRPRSPTLEPLCPKSIHDALLRLADILKTSILHEQQHTISIDILVNNFKSSLLPLLVIIPTESLSLYHLQGWHRHITLSRLLHLFHHLNLLLILVLLPNQFQGCIPPTFSPLVPLTYHHLTTNPSKRRRERAKASKIK